MECTICFDDYDYKDVFFTDTCGHMFCNGCMEETIRTKIREGVTKIPCPEVKCPAEVGYYEVLHLIRNDPELIEKYERFLYEQSIEQMDDVVWCPVAHCGSAVPTEEYASRAKCINCNFMFCIKCRDEVHENSCEWNKKWKGKIDSFEAWREAHGKKIKNCPKCNYMCEKVSGCSAVPCAKCHTTFCWLCAQKIDESGHFDVPSSKGCINTWDPKTREVIELGIQEGPVKDAVEEEIDDDGDEDMIELVGEVDKVAGSGMVDDDDDLRQYLPSEDIDISFLPTVDEVNMRGFVQPYSSSYSRYSMPVDSPYISSFYGPIRRELIPLSDDDSIDSDLQEHLKINPFLDELSKVNDDDSSNNSIEEVPGMGTFKIPHEDRLRYKLEYEKEADSNNYSSEPTAPKFDYDYYDNFLGREPSAPMFNDSDDDDDNNPINPGDYLDENGFSELLKSMQVAESSE